MVSQTSKQYLFQLYLIYGAQAFFMLVFGVVAFFIGGTTQHFDSGFESLLLYILAATVVASLAGAHFVFNLVIRGIDRNLALRDKLQKYLTAVLIRSALLEFPGLFASVVCILTGNLLPLMAVLLILIVFFLLRPSTLQIVQDLGLSTPEKEKLENGETILD